MEQEETPLRALIVDDDPEVCRTVTSALKRVGFECHTAPDGEAGLQEVLGRRVDLLVTDLRMPKKHGHRLVVDVFEQESPPVIVVMTAVAEPAIATDLLKRGVTDVVTKPFDPAICAIKWKTMLERAQPTRIGDAAVIASEKEAVTQQIVEATSTLRAQLKEISASFDSTIQDLERKQEKLEAGFLGSVRLLTQLLRQFDDTDANHAGRVEKLARIIAKSINMSGDALRDVLAASLLHDLGQFGMPDAIRALPPWELSDTQYKAYKKYPEIGATLLSEVPGCEEIVRLVSSHSECFDGTGFPNQLKGTDIPLGARVIRLADGTDTFLMYHKGGNPQESLGVYLRNERGRKFDPRLVDAAYDDLLDYASELREIQCRIGDLLPGDTLAHDLSSAEGHLLARSGATVTETMKIHLARLLGNETIRIYRQSA